MFYMLLGIHCLIYKIPIDYIQEKYFLIFIKTSQNPILFHAFILNTVT